MKLLLSAYACEPYQGSEPGIGWNWAIELAKRDADVFVLTRSNNKAAIESVSNLPNNLAFIYYDLPSFFLKHKKSLGIYIYYNLWQIGAYFRIKQLYGKTFFSLIHHITFGSYRFPSFLYKISRRFIIGPVGGGEQSNKFLISSLPIKYQLIELFRNFINYTNKYKYITNLTYNHSELIITTTDYTAEKFNKKYSHKILVSSAIGINKLNPSEIKKKGPKENDFNILYAGVLVHWKGIHLAIKAFHAFNKINITSTFTIVGKGPFKPYLLKLVKKLNLENSVKFKIWCSQAELFNLYSTASVFLFPSFHDSGGFVILEAMSFGLPVICLDSGAPPLLLGSSKNIINSKQKPQKIIEDLASRLSALEKNESEYLSESKRIIERVELFSWKQIVGKVYTHVNID